MELFIYSELLAKIRNEALLAAFFSQRSANRLNIVKIASDGLNSA